MQATKHEVLSNVFSADAAVLKVTLERVRAAWRESKGGARRAVGGAVAKAAPSGGHDTVHDSDPAALQCFDAPVPPAPPSPRSA